MTTQFSAPVPFACTESPVEVVPANASRVALVVCNKSQIDFHLGFGYEPTYDSGYLLPAWEERWLTGDFCTTQPVYAVALGVTDASAAGVSYPGLALEVNSA